MSNVPSILATLKSWTLKVDTIIDCSWLYLETLLSHSLNSIIINYLSPLHLWIYFQQNSDCSKSCYLNVLWLFSSLGNCALIYTMMRCVLIVLHECNMGWMVFFFSSLMEVQHGHRHNELSCSVWQAYFSISNPGELHSNHHLLLSALYVPVYFIRSAF